MFRTLKLVTGFGFKQLNEKCLSWFSLARTSHNFVPVNFTTRNYGVQSEIVKKDVEFCKIGDIEKLTNLEKELSTQSIQEKICKIILEQDIQVPNLFGCSKVTRPHCFNHRTVPENVSFGRFNAEEDDAIMRNMEKLSKLTKESYSYSEILLADKGDDLLLTKMEIIGSFLSQGFQKIRLPQEVFLRARSLLVLSRGELTEEEKRIIEEHLNSCENFRAWTSLAEKLNRDIRTVETYAKNHLRYKGRTKGGKFTIEESKTIMKAVFKTNKNALFNSDDVTVRAIILDEIAQELNRPPKVVYHHWLHVIQPLLTRYEAGVLEVDFKIPLLEYCIKSDIQYPQNADWKKISSSPEFFGTTSHYLSYVYNMIRNDTQKIYKLGQKEVTTKVMLERLKTQTTRKPRTNKGEEDILDYYENVIKKN